MKKTITSAILSFVAVTVCSAKEWPVSTVSELTNAIAKASADDVIVLAAGTYDLSTLQEFTASNWGTMSAASSSDENGISCIWFKKEIDIKGAVEKHWSEKTAAEESVLDGGNVARIFYGYAANGRRSRYFHLTFANGKAADGKNGGGVVTAQAMSGGYVTNCVFRSCSAENGGGACYANVYDSLFESCSATSNGGGFYLGRKSSSGVNRASRCVVRGCEAASGGGIYAEDLKGFSAIGNDASGDYSDGFVADCVISNCTATSNGGGICSESAGNVVRGCRFESCVAAEDGGALSLGNAMNCVFIGNSCDQFGGGCSGTHAVGCAFTNNFSFSNRGGGMANSVAVDCDFHGNHTQNSSARGGACTHSHCTGCRFSGIGDVSGGSFVNCEFDGVVSNDGNQSYVFDTTSNNGIPIAATNCLVHGCSVDYLVRIAGGMGEFVNCTFADNVIGAGGQTFRIQSSKKDNVITPATNVFINCIVSGNVRSGEAADFTVWNQASTGCATFFTNCMYTAGYDVDGSAGVHKENLKQARPVFAGADHRYAGKVPYYTPVYRSPARDAGYAVDWTADAVDLAGKPRVYGSGVDIGCYETQLPPSGLQIAIR